MNDSSTRARHITTNGPGASAAAAAPAAPASSAGPWSMLALELDATVQRLRAGQGWVPGLFAVHARARGLVAQRADAALYRLMHHAGHCTQHYAAHHALRCQVICELAAELLLWPQARVDALGRAALTMNVAMWPLQDLLAERSGPPTPEERVLIDGHAEAGAAQLARSGMCDALACAVVAQHHLTADPDDAGRLAQLPEVQQLALLLRRVDIFCAKISRRGSRAAMSPVQAARQACLQGGERPDEIGAVLLKVLGLYPPGSWVQLACGEMAIVVERSRRPTQPLVASLVSAGGTPLPEPLLRDTRALRYAVQRSLPGREVPLVPSHAAVLALR